ncbi:MAG: hypothetical protein IPJ76_01265 [Flavobacteriales bacterium]|nr:MAG: hypothetical protein IPJ76_01265 [Flavobacteriales bacterium]
MAMVKVYLNGLSPIREGNRMKYQRLRFNAGMIPAKNWDPILCRPSAAFSKRDGGTLHRSIDFICLNLQRAYAETPMKTAAAVRKRYDELLGKGVLVQRKSTLLLDVVEGWRKRDDRDAHTIHTYTVFGRKVEEYERNQGTRLDLADLTADDLVRFLKWVQSTYSLSPNTMATQNKFVNMALREMRDHGVAVPKSVKMHSFVTPKVEVLDWNEVARIQACEPDSRTEVTAKLILIGLLTSGVRISDTYLYFRSMAKRNGILCADFICSKNAKRHPVTVGPIVFEPVRALLQQYGEPARISEKHIRSSTKDFVQKAGIQKAIQVHSLRRSFVSNFLALGIHDHLLMKCNTGHVLKGELGGGGGRGMLHSYNHGGMTIAQRTMIQMLRLVDQKQTAGIELLSPAVCDF